MSIETAIYSYYRKRKILHWIENRMENMILNFISNAFTYSKKSINQIWMNDKSEKCLKSLAKSKQFSPDTAGANRITTKIFIIKQETKRKEFYSSDVLWFYHFWNVRCQKIVFFFARFKFCYLQCHKAIWHILMFFSSFIWLIKSWHNDYCLGNEDK